MSYGDVALGVECALPCVQALALNPDSRTAAAGAASRKEDRDPAPTAPARFGSPQATEG